MPEEKPINNINIKVDDIANSIKNIRVDLNVIRADLQLIKEAIDKKEKEKDISKGWWYY